MTTIPATPGTTARITETNEDGRHSYDAPVIAWQTTGDGDALTPMILDPYGYLALPIHMLVKENADTKLVVTSITAPTPPA